MHPFLQLPVHVVFQKLFHRGTISMKEGEPLKLTWTKGNYPFLEILREQLHPMQSLCAPPLLTSVWASGWADLKFVHFNIRGLSTRRNLRSVIVYDGHPNIRLFWLHSQSALISKCCCQMARLGFFSCHLMQQLGFNPSQSCTNPGPLCRLSYHTEAK